jgi:PKHD-type hydroxylase
MRQSKKYLIINCMNLTHNYFWIKSAISPEICDEIVRIGTDKIHQEQKSGIDTSAATSGNLSKHDLPDADSRSDKPLEELENKLSYVRDSNVTWLRDSWLYDELKPHIDNANLNAGWGWDYDWFEDLQFTVYKNDQFYGWHMDGGSDKLAVYRRTINGITPEDKRYTKQPNLIGKVRKISMTLNLSRPQDYDGGELKFDFGPHSEIGRFKICDEIKPQGSIIVFPSFLPHCVTPVTRGTRYSLVMWVCGDPFR